MKFSKFIKETDWVYFLFLFMFTNQAIFSLKVLGLVFIYLVRPDLRFRLKEKRLPLFYLLIVSLAVLTFLVKTRDFSYQYIVAFAMGNFFWVAGFLALHQSKISIERYGTRGVYNTMRVFIVFNFLFSIAQIGYIIYITGTWNPYSGLSFPYGMSTGDNIYGLFMQNSYYNMMVSTMLTIYFVFKRNFLFAVLSSFCLILVFGNYGTMVFLASLVGLLLTGILNAIVNNNVPPGKGLRRILYNISPPGNFILYIPMLGIFVTVIYGLLSPENTKYIFEKLQEKVYSINVNKQENYESMIDDQEMDPRAFTMTSDELEKIRAYERQEGKHLSYEEAVVIGEEKDEDTRQNARRDMTRSYIEKLQGKTLSVLETWQYLKSSPANFLFGAGTTRFSSLTAQKMAGYDSSRLFQNVLPHYVSPLYEENHLMIHEERRKGDEKYLSNANWPDSFYNQLFGEYGMLGALCFALFYIGYFMRRISHWSYGFWLLIILLPFMHLVYIFETLSVIVFFEYLMDADGRESPDKLPVEYAS